MMTVKFVMNKPPYTESRTIYDVDYVSFILDGKWIKTKYKQYGTDKILMLKTEDIKEFTEEFIIEEEECE